ncbi:hypothetical protein FRC03_005700 [Tulasnella sp. 419]|nr:hypothetical protein FRC03_005700 [Tulasnella sp. 419]
MSLDTRGCTQQAVVTDEHLDHIIDSNRFMDFNITIDGVDYNRSNDHTWTLRQGFGTQDFRFHGSPIYHLQECTTSRLPTSFISPTDPIPPRAIFGTISASSWMVLQSSHKLLFT